MVNRNMDLSYRKSCMVFGFALVLAVCFVVEIYSRNDLSQAEYLSCRELPFSKNHVTAATNSRRLLASTADYDVDVGGGEGDDDGGDGTLDRISTGCSKESIYISQGQTSPLPNGIPTYTVQVQNICISESCSISDIHLSCGWFSSARLINPNVFRRISYDDCLVNNGNPISPGQTVYFQYANTYPYPMSVSSVSCN